MEHGLPVLILPDIVGVQQFVVQLEILDPMEMEDDVTPKCYQLRHMWLHSKVSGCILMVTNWFMAVG